MAGFGCHEARAPHGDTTHQVGQLRHAAQRLWINACLELAWLHMQTPDAAQPGGHQVAVNALQVNMIQRQAGEVAPLPVTHNGRLGAP